MSNALTKRRRAPKKKDLEILRKRNKIMDLRENGATIRQIAEHLTLQGEKGCSPTRVFELLVEGLEDIYKTQRLKAKHLVQLEINKLDRIELAHFNKLLTATSADDVEKYSRAFERIWKRRDAMLGLHKPQRIEVSARDNLAKLLGRSPEEIPDGDSDS